MYFERGICIYIYIHIYIYILLIYLLVCSFVHSLVRSFVCLLACLFACLLACLFACLFVCVYFSFKLSFIYLFVHLFIHFFLYPAGKEHTWRGEEKTSFIARRDVQCFPETRMNSGFNYSLSGWEEKEGGKRTPKGKAIKSRVNSNQRSDCRAKIKRELKPELTSSFKK